MRKLFISTMALIIGLAFSAGAFAQMEGMEPVEKENPKITQPQESKESKESKGVETKSASSKKKMVKKKNKGRHAKKESAPAH